MLKRLFHLVYSLIKGSRSFEPICYYALNNYHMKRLIPLFFGNKRIPIPSGSPLVPLDLQTYIGLNQTAHPDVIFHDGQYVLVITPYPYGVPTYENPCIYISEDGIHYVPPKSLVPLDQRSGGDNNYLSDPAIVWHNGLYHVYYRECLLKSGPFITKIWETSSVDLINWSSPQQLLESRASFICPALVDESGELFVFYIKVENQTSFLHRCRKTENGFADDKQLTVNDVPDGRFLWHIDIMPYHDMYLGLMTLSSDLDGSNSRLYSAVSHDKGLTWCIVKEIQLFENQHDMFSNIYKSALVETNDGRLDLYTCGQTKKQAWYTYVVPDIDFGLYFE